MVHEGMGGGGDGFAAACKDPHLLTASDSTAPLKPTAGLNGPPAPSIHSEFSFPQRLIFSLGHRPGHIDSPEQIQGSTGSIDLLLVSSDYARKLEAVLITLAGTNDRLQPHNRGSIGQPKLQFKNLFYRQFRSNHSADASAAQIHDAAVYHAALMVRAAYNQTGVKFKSRRSPPT
jgi:hypothetical protein